MTSTRKRRPDRGRPVRPHSLLGLLRAAASALVLAGIVGGLPWLVYTLTGSPIPQHLPALTEIKTALLSRDDGQLFLATLKYLTWIGWALFVALLLLEIIAQIRDRPTPRMRGLGPIQRAVAILITGLTTALAATPSMGRAVPANAGPAVIATAPPAHPVADSTPPQHSQISVAASTQTRVPNETEPASQREYIVKPRDTLWGIAEKVLGDGERYQEIAELNYGRHQPDGRALDRSHWIHPGWRLLLPTSTGAEQPGPPTHEDRTYTVRADDTLWGIAEKILGDGGRYREILQLNKEKIQLDGERLSDPRDIRPGWRLTIPEQADQPSPPRPPPSPPQTSPPPAVSPRVTPTPGPPSGSATAAPTMTPSSSASPTQTATPSASEAPPDRPDQTPQDHRPTVALPSGAVVGVSFAAGVGSALLVSRLHRRRRHRTPHSGPHLARREPEPPPAIRKLRRADLARQEAGQADLAQARDDEPALHLFPLRSNGHISLGMADGHEVTAAISGLTLGVRGPGATAVVRALLIALITHAGDHDIEIVIPSGDAAHVLSLPTDAIDEAAEHINALTVVTDLDAGLRLLDAEHIRRARLLDATGPDLTSVRTADPNEPLPRLVLMAVPRDDHRRRLETICASADVYDMATVVLGECPGGTTVHIEDDGHITTASGADTASWEGLRLFHLAVDDAHQVLNVIRGAHGAEPDEGSTPEHAPEEPPVEVPPPEAEAPGEERAQIRVLGSPAIVVDGKELTTGLRGKARELLTYLALNSDGVTRDAALEALWPDAPHKQAVQNFHAAVQDVRRALRRATGRANEDFITIATDRYRIDARLVAVDLWRFRRALHQASNASGDNTRVALLQEAVDAYQGPLAAEQGYDWVEPEREALRRQAVDALVHLAGLVEREEPERAIAALERAKNIDRYAEEIYQRTMILQARLGRPDAVRRTHRLLETNLEELSADPSEETKKLLWRLLHPRGQQEKPPL